MCAGPEVAGPDPGPLPGTDRWLGPSAYMSRTVRTLPSGPWTSQFLHRGEHTAPPAADRRDADRHESCASARRAPEHRARLERRGSTALLPDQPAPRPTLPARRPPAVPGGG